MNLASRLDRIERLLPPPPRWEERGDPADDPQWMATAKCMGSDHLRELAAEHPEWGLARTIAEVDEWERTEPQWWLEGPFGQRRWRYGIRQGDQS